MRNGTTPLLTTLDVMELLEALLSHGYGELRVVICDHHIETIYPTMSLKSRCQLPMTREILTKE